ncbi:MAG: cytochrome P450 pisatin demethylase [Lasallia pustulata]|uniref:Cytochrome P450 pisatin demethylase n=1 Tax=Lasallia pustulata TaxID=136370 RepID=A0A5M8PYW0_9LECA|nr:MAG: cytochrome P450 pisatin demethylase [Lasallia pustulata]
MLVPSSMAILQTVNRIGLVEILGVIVAVVAARLVYYAFFHPLSIYPGPQLAAQTYLWRFFHYLRGNLYLVDYELHRKYGPVVRDGPNSLLVSDLEAYKSVYGSKVFEKGDFYRSIPSTLEPTAFSAQTYEQHRKARKHVAAGSIRHYHLDLSDHYAVYPKAVAGYEQIVANNVELWINKIASEYCKSDDPANLAPLIGLLQFDSVVELTYGRSIGVLGADEDVDDATGSKEMALRMAFGVGIFPWMSRTFGTELFNAQALQPADLVEAPFLAFVGMFS